MHVCSTFTFVSIFIALLFQILSIAFSAVVAFAILVHTSFLLSRSYVVLLPRYVNFSTFSNWLPSMTSFFLKSFSPNTSVFVFPKFMVNPYLFPSLLKACAVSSSLCASFSIRSMSSAKHRLLILIPLISTPSSLSLILSMTLSNNVIKELGDIGSPCLVPLLVLNQFPFLLPIRTAAVAFPFISLSRRVSLLSTPNESIAAHVMFWSMLSKAFRKSIKQLYILMFFLLAFSPISLSASILLYSASVFSEPRLFVCHVLL